MLRITFHTGIEIIGNWFEYFGSEEVGKVCLEILKVRLALLESMMSHFSIRRGCAE